jgi:hypothetical protein
MEWQPIETAPKDGRHIIGWFGESRTPHAESIYWATWAEKGKDLGLWVWAQDGDSPQVGPTHWMAQPEPPEKVAMTKTEAENRLVSIIKEINDAGFRPTISVIRPETGDDGKTYGAYYLEEILPDHIQIVNDDTESFN